MSPSPKQAESERRLEAMIAALSLNRGELDPAKLAHLLRAVEVAAKPTTS